MSTKTIPTDKNGNVYYGPRTLAEAVSAVDEMFKGENGERPACDIAAVVAESLDSAGYTGVAKQLRNQYGI